MSGTFPAMITMNIKHLDSITDFLIDPQKEESSSTEQRVTYATYIY
jgi:hypothetical protein